MIEQHLRLATLDDIPILLNLAKNFHKVSPYRGMRFNTQKGKDFLASVITGPKSEGVILVALKDTKPIGMLIGWAAEPVFTSNKVATELCWWVEEEYRKTRGALLLYNAYEDWAARVGCSHIQGAYLSGWRADLHDFFKKRGYIQVESSYLKTLKVY